MAAGLSPGLNVDLTEVGSAPTTLPPDLALLVVGGPTHALTLSRGETRQSAADQASGPLVSTGVGLREWLETVQAVPSDVAVAAFDTRIRKWWLPGSAARAADSRLRRLGLRALVPAESLYVAATTGPLLDGGSERAVRWGASLRTLLAARARHQQTR